jgi:PAS domain S-box-containing protein
MAEDETSRLRRQVAALEAEVLKLKQEKGCPLTGRPGPGGAGSPGVCESALHESEEKFRLAFQTSPDSINLNRLSDGLYVDINDGFAKLMGYTREEIIGKTSLELNIWDDPRDRERLVQGLAATGVVDNFEARFRRKNGQVGTGLMSARVLTWNREKVILSITHDITRRKKTEEELRESEAIFSLFLEHCPVYVFFKDEAARPIRLSRNYEQMLGRPIGEILGKTMEELFPSELAKSMVEDDLRVMRNGVPVKVVEEFGGRHFETLKFPITRPNDSRMLAGFTIDITERKHVEEAQLLSERSAKQLAEEKAVIAEIGRIISSSLEIEEVYERFAAAVKKIISFDRIAVNLVDFERQTVCVQYALGPSAAGRLAGDEFPLARTATALAVESGRGLLIPTLPEAELEARIPGHLPVRRAGMKSTLLAPLVAKGKAIGALVMMSAAPDKYTERDIPIAENVAAQVSGAIANAQLLMERKRAEEALRQSEDRYRDLVEHSQDLICTHDLSGRLLSLNPWASHLLGYASDELMRMNLREVIVAEARGRFDEYLAALKAHGSAQGLMVVQTRAGERRIWEYNNTVRTEGVAEPVVRGMAKDVTERKQAERKLRESEERYRSIVEALSDAILIRADGVITYANPAALKLFRTSRMEDLVGRRYLDLVHPDDRDESATRTRRGETEKWVAPTREHRVLALDGQVVPVESTGVPIQYHGQAQIFGVFRDITERRRMEEERQKMEAQFRQAQKMESVGRLAGGVAHDFNNMLSVILGYTDLVLTRIEPQDQIYQDLCEVKSAARRSADLTRQLLAFARKQTIAPKLLDLNDTVASMLKMLGRLIGENIDLLWKPGNNLRPVNMDPAQLDQILANLAVNARDAVIGHGKITIETGNAEVDEPCGALHEGIAPGGYVMLAVSDDGCGMDKETQERLFEPFFTTKEVGKGTGLGLATVYGIVRQNNGFVDVYSEPGQGTTFKIYIPSREPAAETGDPPSASAEAPTGTETVLLVEDEHSLLNFARILLEKLGYTVLAADSPGRAIQLAREHGAEIHLLMTDVVMPEMGGRDLWNQLNALRPGMKCLFMSGYTADAIVQRAVLDHGVHYLQKPFSVGSFARKIREALAG